MDSLRVRLFAHSVDGWGKMKLSERVVLRGRDERKESGKAVFRERVSAIS